MSTPPPASGAPVYYTPTQIGAAAMLAGWSLADVQTVVAIALAESSGQANAVGPVASGSRGYGLMQVMWPMHQDLFSGGIASGYWMDGPTNLQMARSIYGSQGWRAWETYTNGAYRLHLGESTAAQSALDRAISSGGGNVANVAQTILVPAAPRVQAAQTSWAAAHGSSAAPVTSGTLTPAAITTTTPAGDAKPVNTGSTSPLVRFLEVVLGGVILTIGLYKLTAPVTQPVIKGIKTATKIASSK